MHQRVNRQVRLKSRPSGIPRAEHFEIVEAPVPDPSDGEVLVRNIYLSVDPAMRGWVSAVANCSEPVALGGSCARSPSGGSKRRETPTFTRAASTGTSRQVYPRRTPPPATPDSRPNHAHRWPSREAALT